MSIRINVGNHRSSPGSHFIAIPAHRRAMVEWALKRARWIARHVPSADVYYRTLPGFRSLTELLADSHIWINFHPTTNDLGLTDRAFGYEIAIGVRSFRRGRWAVLATLLHELAHVNGVNGAVAPRAAERAVLECGLGRRSELLTGVDDPSTPYDPTVVERARPPAAPATP
jgi:hypothetical protein